jgi:hypothetical protein
MALHWRQRGDKVPESDDVLIRNSRAWEVGLAGALFLLWPSTCFLPSRPVSLPSSRLSGNTSTRTRDRDRDRAPAHADTTVAAIIYTLFPPTPNRPCDNPSASAAPPAILPTETQTSYLCIASCTAISLAWLASWLILARVMGLIFPMPNIGLVSGSGSGSGLGSGLHQAASGEGETQSLLRHAHTHAPPPPPPAPERPKMKWGRMVAGEAFELGGEDD